MLSKNTLKYLTSLRQKKYRDRQEVFVAEGPKLIGDLLDAGLELQQLYTTDPALFSDYAPEIISAVELKKISNQRTPNSAFAVFAKKEALPLQESDLILALDGVQDPGNLGTIIRLSDWFGVRHIVCTHTTVDCYNPKVVQASMGSLARVQLHYLEDLSAWLAQTELPVYGGFMQGEQVYKSSLPTDAVLVMGNEGQGISPKTEAVIATKLSIPNFGTGQESLNVATATAILLSEFKRSIEM
jgi:TrmH family RNA methyltransferase